jgi:hypothetical protein
MRSFFDARQGRVRITVMRGPDGERTASAVFRDGKFQLTQAVEAPYVTDLRLVGGLGLACRTARTSALPPDGAKKKRKRGRRLWGDGKGKFRTSGRYSAATVRGTRWLVEDRCDGTLTRVARGEVEVEDYSDAPPPTPTPTPTPAAPESGEPPKQDNAGSAPQPALGTPTERSGTKKRIKRGQSYLARPRR